MTCQPTLAGQGHMAVAHPRAKVRSRPQLLPSDAGADRDDYRIEPRGDRGSFFTRSSAACVAPAVFVEATQVDYSSDASSAMESITASGA